MVTDKLIELVKRELKITWTDTDTDAEVEALVSDAVPALAFKLGIRDADINFETPGQERRLFLNYCHYIYDDMPEEFDGAYLSEILQLRSKYEVKYGKEETQDV